MPHQPRLSHRLVPAVALAAVAATVLASPAGAAASRPTDARHQPAQLSADQRAADRATLEQSVSAALAHSSARDADWEVDVAGVGTTGAGAGVATAPASNEKIFTATTLLHEVGPDFRYRTRVYRTGTLSHGTVDGDLVLVGSGDPTVTDAALRTLAHAVHAAGIDAVGGDVVVDDARYSPVTAVRGWKSGFVPSQSGTVDAFSVDNDNWRGGTSFAADPTQANTGKWLDALHAEHVITHHSRIGAADAPQTPVATLTSRPLSQIVDMTLTYSINYYAEMMLREAGAQRSGVGTPATGVAAVEATAAALHLPFGTAYDGSGLSSDDRETPATVVDWLQAERTQPSFAAFYAGLPRSCEAGTLQDRLCGKHLTGQVVAKTGTLDHVRALSGYTTTSSGRLVTFSFLLSGITNMTTAETRIDDAVRAVVASTG